MPDIFITTPPIRSPLTEKPGEGHEPWARTASRDWWLYWNMITDAVNENSVMVTQGTHAERPDAASLPDGAIYVESDRGVIYQNQNGVWQYLAGTMWGTITPDQRPADLGVNDGGFNFRGTDDAREFIWSQTQWIEVTEVRYGTHAGRPNPLDVANGVLYVEFDRGSVIYQNQNNTWHYLAGTMFGTLSPDQRPTDLGVNDVGFDFRTSVPPARQFIWSQTAWVEVTPPAPMAQTPWTSNIDGGGFQLGNVSRIGINYAAPASPLFISGTSSGSLTPLAAITLSRFWVDTTNSRASAIFHYMDGAADCLVIGVSGDPGSFTNPAQISQGHFIVYAQGHIGIPHLPSTNPGAGSKKIWYDPADGNRVKFAP